MAFNKHKESDLFILLLTTAFIMPVLATTNIDCKGKAFHCFNSTHFKICVDLGGVSKTVDDFLIPCPPSTVCTENNYFECEYQISTTSAAMPIQSDVTNEFIEKIESTPWELFDVTTLRSVNNVENVTLLENSTITLSEIVSDAVGFEIDNNNTYVNDLLNEEITASYPHNTKKNDLSDSDKSNLPQQVSILNKQLTSTTITSATIDNVSSNISSAAVSENYSGTASDLSIELINTIVKTPLSTGEDVDFTQLFSTVITDNLKKSDSTRKVKNYLTNDISIGVYEPVTTTPMNNIRNNDLISTELLSPLETDNLSTSLATEKSSIYSGSQSKISSNLYKDVTSTSTTTVSEVSAFAKLFSPFKTNDLSPRNSFTTEKSEVLVDLFNSVTKLNNVETEKLNKDFIPTTISFYDNENDINAENVVRSSTDHINFSSFSDYNLESTQKYNTIGPLALATTKANPMSITNVAMKNDNLESSSIKEKKPPINRVDPTSTHTSVADSTLTEIAISSCTESEISIDLNKYVTPSPKNQDYISTKSSYSKKRMDLTPNTTAATKGNIVTKSEILVDLFNPVTKAPLKNVVTEEFNKDLMPTTKYFSENKNYINAENIVKEISSDNINFSSFSDYNLASTQQYTTIPPPTGATTKTNEFNATNVVLNSLESSSINKESTHINRIVNTSAHTSTADSVLEDKVAIFSGTESQPSIDLYKKVIPAPNNQELSSLGNTVSTSTAAPKKYIVTESGISVDLFNTVIPTSLDEKENEELNKDFIPTKKSFLVNENYINAENIGKGSSSDNINLFSFSDYNLLSTQQYTTIGPPTGATTKANELNAMRITNVAKKTNTLESTSINDKNSRTNRIDSTQTSMADFVLKEKKEIYSDAEREISMDLYKHAIPAPKNQDYTSTKIPSSQEKVDLSPINSITTAATKEYTVTESEILADLFNPVKTTPMNNIENEELNKEYIPTTKSLSANENYLNTQNILKEISSDNINFSSFSDYELASTQQYTTIGPPTGASTKANELNAMSITNLAMKTNTLESYSIDDKTTRINSIDSTQTSMADLVLTEKTEISSEAESVISMDLYKHVIAAPKDQDYTSTKLSFLQEKIDLAPTNSITTAAIKEYTVTESEILVDLFNPVTTTSMNNMETEEINKDNIPTTKSLSANENYIITQNIVNGSSSNNMNFSSLSDYNFASTQQYTTLDPQIQNNTIYNELNAVSFYKNASEFYTNVAMKTSQRLEDSTTAASAADATLVALNNTMEGFSITEQHDFVPLISKSNLISEKIETSSLLDSDGGNVYQSTNMKGVNLQSKASTINLNGWFTNITKKISNGAVKEILMPKNESDIKGTTSPSADFIPKVTNAYSDETNFTAPVNIRLNNTTDLFLIQDNNVLPSPIMLATENIVTKSSDVYDTTIRIIAESHITNTNQDNNMTNANLSILYINNETPLYPSTTENQIPLKTENVTYGMGISKNVTKIDISTRMIINEHNSTSAKPVNLNTKPLIYYNNSYAGSNDNIFSSTNTQTTTENVAKSLSLILQSSEITQTKDSSSREGNILPPLVRDIQNSSFGEAKKTIIFHTSRDLKLDKGSTYSISKKEFPVSTEFILTKTSKNIFNDKIRTIDEDQDNITPALEINNNRISSTSSGMHILVSTDRPSLLRPDLLYNKNKYATNTLKPIPSQLKNSNFQSNTAPAKIQNENTTKGNTILTNHTKANSQITQMQMKKTSIPEKELRVSATPTIDFVDIAIKSKNISTYSILSDNINNENNKIKEEPTKIVSEFGGLNIQDNIAKSVLLSNQQLQNVTHNNANNSQLHKKKNIDSTDYTYNKLILDGNTQSPSFDKIDIALQPLKTKIETISLGVERNNEAKDTLSRNLVNISAINGQLFHKSAESRTIRPNSLMNRSSSFYLPSFKNHTFNNSTSKVINLTDVNNIFLVNFMNKQRESLDTANQSSKFNRTQIITKLVDNSSTSSSNTYNMFILKIKVQFNNKSNNLDKYHNNQNVRKTTVRVLKNDDKGLEKNTNKTNIDLMNRNVFNSETTESKFSCNNRHRGKYSDKNNCQNFYICIGRREPIFGECPNKTVFSEISKQCTKNLSHCIRNNQFQCVSPGRFIDIFSDQFYYICVKKKEGHIRFKLKCQKGYHLNKTNLQCVLDLFNGSKSNEDSTKFDSDKSTTESKSKEDSKRKNEEMKNFKDFECKKEGKFVYQNDCRKYYQCSRSSRTVFRRKIKKCDSDEVFNNEKKKCVDEESYECK